jgi:hypothetical protein
MELPRIAPLLALLAALAAPAGAQPAQRQVYQVSPGPPLAVPPAPALTQREAIRRWLCPNGGSPMRGRPGRCDGRGGPRGGGADSAVAGWFDDLPPATRRQTACPEGTTPTAARAQPQTVRCVPG